MSDELCEHGFELVPGFKFEIGAGCPDCRQIKHKRDEVKLRIGRRVDCPDSFVKRVTKMSPHNRAIAIKTMRQSFRETSRPDRGSICVHGRLIKPTHPSGTGSCAPCSVEEAAARKAGPRAVQWGDTGKMSAFYAEAIAKARRTGIPHEVDHVIPLRGKLVSGLHVENNLRVLTKVQNRLKHNRFDPVAEAA